MGVYHVSRHFETDVVLTHRSGPLEFIGHLWEAEWPDELGLLRSGVGLSSPLDSGAGFRETDLMMAECSQDVVAAAAAAAATALAGTNRASHLGLYRVCSNWVWFPEQQSLEPTQSGGGGADPPV